jgi:hypothetical protein
LEHLALAPGQPS